jgi:hypothetical protein
LSTGLNAGSSGLSTADKGLVSHSAKGVYACWGPTGHVCTFDNLVCKSMAELPSGRTAGQDVCIRCLNQIVVGHIYVVQVVGHEHSLWESNQES